MGERKYFRHISDPGQYTLAGSLRIIVPDNLKSTVQGDAHRYDPELDPAVESVMCRLYAEDDEDVRFAVMEVMEVMEVGRGARLPFRFLNASSTARVNGGSSLNPSVTHRPCLRSLLKYGGTVDPEELNRAVKRRPKPYSRMRTLAEK